MATREEIADLLLAEKAEQEGLEYTASDAIVDQILADTEEETGFTRWAQYSAASSMMGLAQIAEDLGLGVDFDEEEALLYRDLATVASEDNPLIGLAGGLVGSTVDVAGGGLAGGFIRGLGKITNKIGAQGWNNLFTQGLAGGAVGGFLEPILTEEDSRLVNVGIGTAFGGVLGGAAQGISRLMRGPDVPTPTTDQGQLALPAPTQPVALLPSPEVATPRIPFQPDPTGKPATAGGVVQTGQESTGLPPIQGYPAGVPAAPGTPAPRGSATPIRPVDWSEAESFNALSIVRNDLLKLTDEAQMPSKADLKRAETNMKQLADKITAREKALSKAKRGRPSRAIQKQLDELRADYKKNQEVLLKRDTVKQAKVELNRLDNGQVSPLVLDRIANVAKKKPLAKAVEETTPAEPRPSAKAAVTKEQKKLGTAPTAEATATQGQEYKFFEKPETEPTPPPNVQTRESIADQILARRADDAESTAGAQQVDPATAMVDQAKVDRVPVRSTQAKEAQGPVRGQGGRKFTDAELRRRKMYQDAEDVGRQYFFEPSDQLGKGYSYENIEEAARVLQDDVNDMINEGNFKDAGDWVIKTFNNSRTKTLTPAEQLVASRVFAIASDNLNKLMPMYRKMLKEGALDTPEAVRMTDDLQVTTELMRLMRQLERIDEASRRNVSNQLRNYKLANKYQQKHQKELMEGKVINDLFFGVKCG